MKQRAIVKPVTRYVVTHVNADGQRQMTWAAQGRNTHATREEAERALVALHENNAPHILAKYPHLEVRPIECYPGHFDPVGIYVD